MADEDFVDEYLAFIEQHKAETLENYERFLKECPHISSVTPTEGEDYEILLDKLSVNGNNIDSGALKRI